MFDMKILQYPLICYMLQNIKFITLSNLDNQVPVKCKAGVSTLSTSVATWTGMHTID